MLFGVFSLPNSLSRKKSCRHLLGLDNRELERRQLGDDVFQGWMIRHVTLILCDVINEWSLSKNLLYIALMMLDAHEFTYPEDEVVKG